MRRQNFNCDYSIEAGIAGFVNLPHSTRTNSGEDFIGPKRLPGRIGMGSHQLGGGQSITLWVSKTMGFSAVSQVEVFNNPVIFESTEMRLAGAHRLGDHQHRSNRIARLQVKNYR